MKHFEVLIGDITLEDFTAPEIEDHVKSHLQGNIQQRFFDTYDEIWAGDMTKIAHLPVESLVPLLFAKHAGSFAKEAIMTHNSR